MRFPFSWFDLRDSLWYRPAVMTVVAILLSFFTIWLDHVLFRERRVEVWWLFEGGSEGARGVLTAIASTTITVATTAFSFTLVALQLSSSQYSPRIVRNFTGDRTNQLVIGVFVATFVYSLLVLRVVRSEFGDRERFVPAISVTVALLLAIICIGSLIYFFHHATRTIQASVIIARATEQTKDSFDRLRERLEGEAWRLSASPLSPPPADLTPVDIVRSSRSGYVDLIAHHELLNVAVAHDALIQVQVRPGDFVLPEDPLLVVWGYPDGAGRNRVGKNEDNGPTLDDLRDALNMGLERTLEADVLYGLQQVSDIALRALSPGINDPNTAVICVDHLAELLVALYPVSGRAAALLDDDGVVRVTGPEVTWEEMVRVGFLQLRHYAMNDIGASLAVIRGMDRVMAHVPPEAHRPLLESARDMAEAALDQHAIESDRRLIRDALSHVEHRA